MQLKNKARKPVSGKGMKAGIAVSRFNEDITKKLLDAAKTALQESGIKETDITVLEVPGAVEIPYALQELARTKKYTVLIAIGCVIQGDTPHFDYVCKMAQEGTLRVSLDHHIPIGFGVLTVNTEKQARARIHVGAEAAMAALELANLKK